MKLHSPQFEKTLRHGVKKAIKASPTLKREFRAAKKLRRQYSARIIGRPVMWILIGSAVWAVTQDTGHPAAGLAIVSLWTFMFVLIHALAMRARLFSANDLAVLFSLPISTDVVFRWELQKFARGTLWSLMDLIVAFGMLAALRKFSPAHWCAAMVIAVLTWLLTLSLAAWCAAQTKTRWITKWFSRVVLGFWFGLIGMLIFHWAINWAMMLSLLDHLAPTINLLLPTGWAVSLFQLLLPDRSWILAGLLVPIAAVIYTVPDSLKRLCNSYSFTEVIQPKLTASQPGFRESAPRTTAAAEQAAGETPRPVGPTEIAEIIQTRGFLAVPEWPKHGPLETWLWRWFTPREQALSEFAFADGLKIFATWKRIFRDLAIVAVTGFVAGTANHSAEYWVFFIGIAYTFSMVLACTNNAGRMFRGMLCSGVRIPLYTNIAAGFLETARMMLKVTAVQIPLVLLWSMSCGVLIAHLAGLSMLDGILGGARGGCLLCATRFLFLVLGFSSGTNDTAGLGIRNLLLIACIVPLALSFLVLGALGLFFPKPAAAWGFTALAVLDAYAFFRVYAGFYHLNFFDLISVPKR